MNREQELERQVAALQRRVRFMERCGVCRSCGERLDHSEIDDDVCGACDRPLSLCLLIGGCDAAAEDEDDE